MSDIILRPYQAESIEALRDGFRASHKHQILVASTGSGKSVIAMSMLDAAMQKGSRVMFVCDRRVLVDQFSRHLDRHGIDHGIYMAGHWRHRPHAHVQVASVQTLERMESWPAVDLMIIDEIHAVMRKSVIRFLENNERMLVIGLTATPFHPELARHFPNVVNVVTMRQLVDEEYLVPFRVFAATEIDTSGVKVVAGEWQQDELEQRGLKVVGDVVSDYVKLTEQVFAGRPRKTICFSTGVAHGAALVQQFAAAGFNFVQISYKDDETYKQDVLADFAKPDTQIQGVISSDILTRGFDQTDVEHIIVAKPLRKSFSMHVQIIGRGARSHDGKEFCVIQDNSGNWLRFADDFDVLYHDGVESLMAEADKKTRKEPDEKEKKEARCPVCRHIWPARSDVCPQCGHVRERRSLVEAVPGVLSELVAGKKKDEKFSPLFKQNWYAQLLGYCDAYGKKPGMAFHLYREKFGVVPAGAKPEPIPCGPAVHDWVRARNIAWAKRNRAA